MSIESEVAKLSLKAVTKLPVEIIRQIARDAAWDDKTASSDLYHFSLVARSWRYPGTEILWETIQIQNDSQLYKLVDLFTQVPRLGTYIKEIVLQADDHARDEFIMIYSDAFAELSSFLPNLVSLTLHNVIFLKDGRPRKKKSQPLFVSPFLKTFIYTPPSDEDVNLDFLRLILDLAPGIDELILNFMVYDVKALPPLITCPVLRRLSITHNFNFKIFDTKFPFIPSASLEQLKFFHLVDDHETEPEETDDWSKIIEIAGESIRSFSIETTGFDYSLLKKLPNLEKLFIDTRELLPVDFLQLIPSSVQIFGRARIDETHLLNLKQFPRPDLKIFSFQFCDLNPEMFTLLPESVLSICLPGVNEDDFIEYLVALQEEKAKGNKINLQEIVMMGVFRGPVKWKTRKMANLKRIQLRQRFFSLGIQLVGGNWYPETRY